MFSETDIQMMRFALEEARIAFADGEIPVGAVVADGERVLARPFGALAASGTDALCDA